jgi:hypothetical protein
MQALITFFLWLTLLPQVHDFHSSLTVMEYEPKDENYEITIRLFTDDIENLLQKTSNKKIPLESAEAESALKIYLSKHFTVKAPKSRFTNWEWVGFEAGTENSEIFVLYRAKPNTELIVENSILSDLFSDQQNIVNKVVGPSKHSHLFSPGSSSYTFPAATQ